MNQGAKVRSVGALADFRTSLSTFGAEVAQSLAAVDVEIRRTLDWLQHDQLKYWQQEVRRREDAVGEARNELSRCLISTTAGGTQAGCTDQKVALEKAKKRLEQAREKVEVVRRWGQIVEQEVHDYRGPAQQLSTLVEGSLPQAMAILARKIQILEEYASVAPAGAAEAPLPGPSAGEVTTSRVPAGPLQSETPVENGPAQAAHGAASPPAEHQP